MDLWDRRFYVCIWRIGLRGGYLKSKYARTKKLCSLKDAQSNLQDMFEKNFFDSGKKGPPYAHITTFGPLFFQLFLVSRFSQAWVVGKDWGPNRPIYTLFPNPKGIGWKNF